MQSGFAVVYDLATYDARGPAPGTTALWNIIKERYPSSTFLGIYNARTVRGSDSLSLHAEGRAVDFRPPQGATENAAAWLRENAGRLGIQEIIVYGTRRIWTTARASQGWRHYSGVAAGMNHIHVGQHRQGAGLTGKGIDAAVIARTMREALEQRGLRWWHVPLGAAGLGGLIAGLNKYGSPTPLVWRNTKSLRP